MRLFGLEITRATKAALGVPVTPSGNGWWPTIREPYAGAWQRNREINADSVLAFHAVYACITLIAADVGKLRSKLVRQDENGIWSETSNPAFSPVLRKPNRFQNHIQFKEWWTSSRLSRGNAYALKERDNRGVVVALYLLDPSRVAPLVAPDGSVFYRLGDDNLAGGQEATTVPASEIIHDRMNCLFHPLIGTSPIFACGLAAGVGMNIQSNASDFFANGSNPSGILTAPGTIPEATAQRMRERWESGYGGRNSGRVAVLGDGLAYQPLRMSAVEAQMIEHLHWTAETVCSTFHVPAFKIGVGPMPTFQNGETLNQIYYSDCLQSHIESFELAMDEGLGLDSRKDGGQFGVELDLDGLFRMDMKTQVETLSTAIKGGVFTPNEARAKVDKIPVTGGDTVYLQEQEHSLEWLAARDKQEPVPDGPPEAPPPPAEMSLDFDPDDWTRRFLLDAQKVAA